LAAKFQQNMSNQLEPVESMTQDQLQQALQVDQTAQDQMQVSTAKVNQRQKQIEAMQRSWSWPLIWPMCLAGDLVMHQLATTRKLTNQTVTWGLNTFQKPLTKVMTWVLARPQLTRRINGWLMRFPHLHGHLSALAQQKGAHPPTFKHYFASNQDKNNYDYSDQIITQLSPRTRQIYADLNSAIAQKNTGQH
jgi:hypothetical protein